MFNTRILENGCMKLGCFFGFFVEPQVRRDWLHGDVDSFFFVKVADLIVASEWHSEYRASTELALLRCPFVNDHPRCPKLIAQHGKPVSEERLLHRHKDLAAIGKESKNTLSFAGGVDREGEINAAHWLKTFRGHITSHQVGLTDALPGIQDGVFLIGRYILRIRLLAMGHHHGDLSAEMLFIETESLRAIAAVIEVGV
jgi:hypothetical protein